MKKARDWEKIFAYPILDKRFVSKYIKTSVFMLTISKIESNFKKGKVGGQKLYKRRYEWWKSTRKDAHHHH